MKKYILLILLQFCIYTLYCQSLSLTDTKGSVSVGASGDAVYSVPIPTPFGLNGVGPSISLTYSSGGANTIAGYGWNIAGLSSISRAGNRLDIDGNLSPIQLNTEDKFIFEGQRLILKSGTYGLDGSVYETEYYSNIKITYSISNNSFTVFYPSGIRAFYGISEDSKTPTDWLLKKWIDPQGNYILYEYDKDETQTYITTWVQYGDRPNQRYPVQNIGPIVNNNSKMIKTIRWGKNENFTNNFENTMVFNYVDKLRPEFTYINNTKIKLTKLLNSIEINCNGNLFRRYQLTHETISGNYQRLIKVQEYNNNNEAANPIEFEYNNTSNDINGTGYSNSQHLINSYRQLTGDFDGDGNIDFIVDNNLYLNNLLNNNWSPTANLLNYNFRAWNTAITLSNENKLNNAQSIVGIKPFATSDAAGSYGINIKTLDIVNNTLIENFNFNLPIRCFDKNVNVASTFSWTYSYYIVTPITYTGDFDGDGLSEILIETKDLLTQSYYPYNSITNSLSPQKFFISKLKNNINTSLNNADFFEITDLNLYKNVYVQDFNGDGKSDILTINSSTKAYNLFSINLINTAPFYVLTLLSSGNINTQLSDFVDLIEFGDFNGDKKTDFVLPNNLNSSLWQFYYSTGSNFVLNSINLTNYNPFWEEESGAFYTNYRHNYEFLFTDFNKDGKTDFVIKDWIWFFGGYADRDSRINVLFYTNEGENNFVFNTRFSFDTEGESTMRLIFGEIKDNIRYNSDFIVTQDNSIWKYKINKNLQNDLQLTKIKEINN